MARLVIDSRERGLIQHLATKRATYHVASLPVGDVLCTYGDESACSWVMERKRADDLACSIKDGRWREQTSRLFASGRRVLFVIEGDLRFLDGMYASMMGAMINSNLKGNARAFRTWDVEETAHLVLRLVQKMQKCPAPAVLAAGLRPPQSKRQRESEAESVFIRQLMCVPSVSERIAVTLVKHFGDVETLQEALRLQTFPKVKIGEKTYLGKARIAKLAKHFLRSGSA